MNTFKKLLTFSFMISFCFLSLIKVHASDEQKEEKKDNKISDTAIYTSTGLVAVGGAGALVISINAKKEKDVPSKEINSEITENEK